MRLKTIKEKQVDEHYTKYVFKEIDLIKKECKISQSSAAFFLGYFYFGQIFFIDGKVYVASSEMNSNPHQEPDISTMVLSELFEIKLLKKYPKTIAEIDVKAIIANPTENNFSADKFLNWIDEPCDITVEVDLPYYEVIEFFSEYSNETFRTERYLFYSKQDEDYGFINNIYAYDTKCNAEIKLYIPDKRTNIEGESFLLSPQSVRDIVVENLSGKLSLYQQRLCKVAFIKLVNEYNVEFNIKNYYLMELVKLAIQPVEFLHEWSSHRIFTKDVKEKSSNKRFTNIWVYDMPSKKETPSFFITDSPYAYDTTKIAVLNFKSPTYNVEGIYKRYNVKFKGWKLDRQYIKELMEFLQAPCDKDVFSYRLGYDKYVKTNWQQLIFEYNSNTAGWGWGDKGFDIPPELDSGAFLETLPFDLPMPDYMNLLNCNKGNEND